MPDANWIDAEAGIARLARALESQTSIGLDTEFLRERTFYPKLCLLQLAAGAEIWCVDTLRGSLEAIVPTLIAAHCRKVIHAARQDLEALYLATRHIVAPVFDTQIAAGCVGMKPQIGYAELVKTLLGVELPKGQTRTDWSKRPLSSAQLDYAADDVRYLDAVAERLNARLQELGRSHWAAEDCAALCAPQLYEPDPTLAWERLRGIGQLPPVVRARAKAVANWREKVARERDLPRAWIIADAAIFAIAESNTLPPNLNEGLAGGILRALDASAGEPVDAAPPLDARPTPEQKALIERLVRAVDARAAELKVNAELLAPRSELKALALGKRDTHALSGWRRDAIGARLLALL